MTQRPSSTGLDTAVSQTTAFHDPPLDREGETPFDDKLHEECGVFGVFNARNDLGLGNAAELTLLGLHALQHRGQEAAGILTFKGGRFHLEKRFGQVGDSFKEHVISRLPGGLGIGHTRYSTAGDKDDSALRNVQPLFAELNGGGFAVAHNGNLTNAEAMRAELVRSGAIFQSTSDTECIIHLTAQPGRGSLIDRFAEALRHVEGAYSLVAMTSEALIGVRDPLGIRPLVLGRLRDTYVLASETCAFDLIGAEFEREIAPGEMVIITAEGVTSRYPYPRRDRRLCIFELVYFSRPDSIYEGRSVHGVRRRIGAELAREWPVTADVVVPIPDSGIPAALGYAKEAGIEYDQGIVRNHYVGRTFIQPSDETRNYGVRLKHNPMTEVLEGRRVVLVDDSIVRGTTSRRIVQMVREAGATEVHMRIASPPTIDSCFYGVDTPQKSKLLASQLTVEDMSQFIDVDSLGFLSINGLYRAVTGHNRNNGNPGYCDACFTSKYPTERTDFMNGEQEPQLSLLAERV